ncbi:hypothetical protein BJ138DRAFT_525164 [Hygrophoropsis aurantiaca]|uniref:Uncharacterized protein n=1 Tax=Hygrophoropsis aurantiaca TaxID=72124 RepID=A0ACB8A1D2_9AGAM|nr:hypothetical protein BJ138DRAFT_525164 [Hygrophoropsis aurantiaca]
MAEQHSTSLAAPPIQSTSSYPQPSSSSTPTQLYPQSSTHTASSSNHSNSNGNGNAGPSDAQLQENAYLKSSQAEVWYLKDISFEGASTKIITQNFNGPCSFIAICNILILRGDITLPPTRTTVSYEFLAQLVGEHLLLRPRNAREQEGEEDVMAALAVMPSTTKGLDLNPVFASPTSFSPTSSYHPDPSTANAELKLFKQADIPLVHGWLVDTGDNEETATYAVTEASSAAAAGSSSSPFEDPFEDPSAPSSSASPKRHRPTYAQSPESRVLGAHGRARDYDSAVALIAEADYITGGRLLGDWVGEGAGGAGASASGSGGVGASGSGGGAGASASGSQGRVVGPNSPSDQYSEDQREIIGDAIIAQTFLESTKSQLTYHGLFRLASLVQPGSLIALFRNSHLSVLYKPRPADASANSNSNSNIASTSASASNTPAGNGNDHTDPPPLLSLVTDQIFLREPSVVWERLEDVDGGWSTFVDSEFRKSEPVGGDFAGVGLGGYGGAQGGEQVPGDGGEVREEHGYGWGHGGYENPYAYGEGGGVVDPMDHALATQLQAEEDERMQRVYSRREEVRARQAQSNPNSRNRGNLRNANGAGNGQGDTESKRSKKMKDKCIIM